MSEPERAAVPTREVELAELWPVLREVLDSGGSFTLTVTGTSMYPTLLGGRDQVVLQKPDRPLRKRDLPLYRRENGQFVLHRIVSVRSDGTFVCCGDHQWVKEPGIRSDQALALAVGFCRKGRHFFADARRYRLWVRIWTAILPLRKPIFIFAGLLSRIRKKIRRK